MVGQKDAILDDVNDLLGLGTSTSITRQSLASDDSKRMNSGRRM
jgi:hypothetical protein